MRLRYLIISVAFLTIFMQYALPQTAHAVTAPDWRAGRIIDDSIFMDSGGFSVAQIQNFLNQKVGTGGYGRVAGQCDTNGVGQSELGGGTRAQYGSAHSNPAPFTCLKDFYEVPKTDPGPGVPVNNYGSATIPAGAKGAAQIIYDAAQRYGINPEVLLVMIQKESAGPLTTDDWPFASQYTYAMGAHCPDGPNGAQCDSNYAGFSIQINESARLLRYYVDNMSQPWWSYAKPYQNNNVLWNTTYSSYVDGSGKSVSCGGANVYIETQATAALYTYTPYQPNQAALNNMYGSVPSGTGFDSRCAAYGNRNFWRYFNDLFGSTLVPPSTQYIPDGIYAISNPTSGKVLDVAGGSSADGASAQIYSANATAAQQWRITRGSDGFYTITNVGSNKSLDVMGASATSGTRVQIWTNNSGCSQRWSARIIHGGISFLSTCSGLALDVTGGSTSNGTSTQVYNPNGGTAQTWQLEAVDPPTIPDGFYSFIVSSGLALSTAGTSNGSSAQINSSVTDGSQYWKATRQVDGMYRLFNPLSGRYLDVASEGRLNGTGVQVWDEHATCAQEWQFASNSNGSYTLLSACSGLALDVTNGASSTPGTNLQLFTSNGTPAQQWLLNALAQIPDATYAIFSTGDKVLDAANGGTTNGTRVQLWTVNGTPAQRWAVHFQGNGLYTLQNINSGKFLNVAGASTSPGAAVQLYNNDATCAVLWKITNNGNSTYKLLSSCTTSNVLDVTGGAVSTPGAKAQTYSQNGSSAQMWIFDAP